MSSKPTLWRRRRVPLPFFLILIALFTVLGLLMVDLRSIDPSSKLPIKNKTLEIWGKEDISANMTMNKLKEDNVGKNCATVEEMGEIFSRGYMEESLRVRKIIHNHFALNGASRVRELHPEEFCNHGFVIGKASEAGLGNEVYKILTAAALSVMLNRSLIIGQTRHIGSLSSLSICSLHWILDLCFVPLNYCLTNKQFQDNHFLCPHPHPQIPRKIRER